MLPKKLISYGFLVFNLYSQFVSTSQSSENKKEADGTNHLAIWQQVFRLKRSQQLLAVKSLMDNDNVQNRLKTLKLLTDAMQKVIVDSRDQLAKAGFEPGLPFPEETSTKEALSRVLENTAFFADLTLHLPDLVRKLYKSDMELQNLILWSVDFSNRTKFFDDSTSNLIYLFSQELNLVERREDYVNPYRESYKREREMEEAEKLRELNLKKTEKKKKTNAEKKGPHLSSSRNAEL